MSDGWAKKRFGNSRIVELPEPVNDWCITCAGMWRDLVTLRSVMLDADNLVELKLADEDRSKTTHFGYFYEGAQSQNATPLCRFHAEKFIKQLKELS